MKKEEYCARIRKKYPYLDYDDVEEIFECAKENLINTYDPNHRMPYEIPSHYTYKVLEVAYEIINLGPMRNLTTYKENGCLLSKDYTGLSSLQDINPIGG